mmetsp:Transcript_73988/g.124635  ORF Transcript_73988/g.124635 Transcript_73988/m.124635 type:complete len:306 (-) Transcript_73988:426-1343(-)
MFYDKGHRTQHSLPPDQRAQGRPFDVAWHVLAPQDRERISALCVQPAIALEIVRVVEWDVAELLEDERVDHILRPLLTWAEHGETEHAAFVPGHTDDVQLVAQADDSDSDGQRNVKMCPVGIEKISGVHEILQEIRGHVLDAKQSNLLPLLEDTGKLVVVFPLLPLLLVELAHCVTEELLFVCGERHGTCFDFQLQEVWLQHRIEPCVRNLEHTGAYAMIGTGLGQEIQDFINHNGSAGRVRRHSQHLQPRRVKNEQGAGPEGGKGRVSQPDAVVQHLKVPSHVGKLRQLTRLHTSLDRSGVCDL